MLLRANSQQECLSQKFNRSKLGFIMSRHSSFGKAISGTKKRNVLKRYERIDVLKKLGRWDMEKNQKVTGLPKTLIPA